MKQNVYAKSNEKFVTTVIIYADGEDNLFYDSTAKNEAVKKEDLMDLYLKGVTVSKESVLYSAICCKTDNLIGYDGASAVTFKCKSE